MTTQIPQSVKNFIAKIFYVGVKNYEEDSPEIILLNTILDQVDHKHKHLPLSERVVACAVLFMPNHDQEYVQEWLKPHGVSLNSNLGLEFQKLNEAQKPIMQCLADMVGLGFLNIHPRTVQVYQEIAERQAAELLAVARQEEMGMFFSLLDYLSTNKEDKDFNITNHHLVQLWSWTVICQTNKRTPSNEDLLIEDQPFSLVGHQIIWAQQFAESRCFLMGKEGFEVHLHKNVVSTLPVFASKLRIQLLLDAEKGLWKELFRPNKGLNYKELSIKTPVGPQIDINSVKGCFGRVLQNDCLQYGKDYDYENSYLSTLEKGISIPTNYSEISMRDLQEGIPVYLQGNVDYSTGYFEGITGEKIALGLTNQKFLIENPNNSSYKGFGSLHYIEGRFLLTLAHMAYLQSYYAQISLSFLSELQYHTHNHLGSLLDILRAAEQDFSRDNIPTRK